MSTRCILEVGVRLTEEERALGTGGGEGVADLVPTSQR